MREPCNTRPVRLLPGDMRVAMRRLRRAGVRFDAVVTDPPYHLSSIVRRFGSESAAPARVGAYGAYARAAAGFMGKSWDGGGISFDPATWGAVRAVMKPGAHLVAFGGTRGWHLMACAIEDAGFEIRDCLMWLYGTGFPKSHDVSRKAGDDWAGWGTALKPAVEPIVLARVPLDGTVADNVMSHGTGALNIDGCRVPYADDGDKAAAAVSAAEQRARPSWYAGRKVYGSFAGDGAATLPAFLQAQALGRWPANVLHDGGLALPGGAARFFYSAKATAADRDGSHHPTVKPVALMQWLARLVTPPGGLVLDPFAGSGTTGAACAREGLRAVLVEREAEYRADIRRRIARLTGADTPAPAADGSDPGDDPDAPPAGRQPALF